MLALSGADPVAQRQHVVTSRPMMSRYDPWVNMLRTTVAAFAAGVGGADAVTVLPFDSPLGRPDAFGRRIARNTSAVLVEESHLGRVTDPAGGSFAVEKLTHDFCLAAWDIVGAVEDGATWDDLIAPVVARRDEAVARRGRPLTGLSEFPHLGESLPTREPDDTWGEVRRYGAAFEAMRDDPAARPVFLATLGPGGRAHGPGHLRHQPVRRRRGRGGGRRRDGRPPTTCSRRTPGSRSSAWPAPTAPTPRAAPRRSPPCAPPGPPT